jgi:hypothetical protein
MTKQAVVTSNTGFPSVMAAANAMQIDDSSGLPQLPTSDTTGTPGSATHSTPTGQAAFAGGSSTVTITNPLVTTKSIVLVSLQGNDGTLLYVKSVPVLGGSFIVNGNANATATLKFGYVIFNS